MLGGSRMLLKSLLLFVGFAAAIYLGLIRNRRWLVAHFSRRARTAHFAVCLAVAGAAAAATVHQLGDELLCPAGYADPDLDRTRTTSGKTGLKIVCRSADGHIGNGSVAAGLFALLGVAVLAFAGASAIWRRFGPPAPPAPMLAADAPTDKRERRRERKRAQRRGPDT
jgi:hypothetical protein